MNHCRSVMLSLSLALLPSLAQAITPVQQAAAFLKAGDSALAAHQFAAAEQSYQRAADAFHLAQMPTQEAAAYEKLAAAFEQEADSLLAPPAAAPAQAAPVPKAAPLSKPAPTPKPVSTTPPQNVPAARGSVTITVPAQVPAGKSFPVHVSGFAGDPGDWVTVVPVGTPDKLYDQYFYANSKREMDFTFTPLDPGQYEVKVFFDKPNFQNIVQARRTFTVTGTAKAKGPVPASLPRGIYQCFLYAPHVNFSGGFTMQLEPFLDINLGSAEFPFRYDAAAGKLNFTGGLFNGAVADAFFRGKSPAIGFHRPLDGTLVNCWPR
ncbi:hypothetical protein [Deinococcus sp. AJ005]|uniref:hypothetical protein n=1 Tax=Deinococcus sp. AJ005 TaxID=2652443 RepID=UPI00125CD267|nr:hypothetical protein [Deinococcus sp. AJ005]QFP76822.1 hypothetical protein DAAJ005_10415 [Deinococcus sp. AJ005]